VSWGHRKSSAGGTEVKPSTLGWGPSLSTEDKENFVPPGHGLLVAPAGLVGKFLAPVWVPGLMSGDTFSSGMAG
jgi:hypothetical protein